MQHQLVLNGDVLPGNLPMLTLQLVEGEHAACWHGDRLVSMTLTSGSTGLPKAVAVHSANAHLGQRGWRAGADAVCRRR